MDYPRRPAAAWQADGLPRVLRRIVRRIIKDSLRWSTKVVSRLDRPDDALQEDLSLEAAAFGACMLCSQLKDASQRESVLTELQLTWERLAPRESRSVRDLSARLLSGDIPSEPEPLTDEKLAREFQNLTGLSPEAWVGSGWNLATLLFYQRVFARIRVAPQVRLGQRAEILHAARQCKDRFKELLASVSLAEENTVGKHVASGVPPWDIEAPTREPLALTAQTADCCSGSKRD